MSTTALPPPATRILDILKDRRTIYSLSKDTSLSEEKLIKLIKGAVRVATSANDSQTTRVCILLGQHHDTFWNMTKAALYKVTSAEHAAAGAGKIEACFQSGVGTVLFFEDERAMQAMKEECETEQHSQVHDDAHYRLIADRNCAGAQIAVWSVLTQAGLGASLQHYQTLMGESVRQTFQIPPWWKLNAMMPFGGVARTADAKTYSPTEARFLVLDEDGLSSYGGGTDSRSGGSHPSRNQAAYDEL